MQITQNRPLGSSDLQNQNLSHVDNFIKNVVVTSSTHNLTTIQQSMDVRELNKLLKNSSKEQLSSILEDIFFLSVSEKSKKSLNKSQLYSKYLIQLCEYFEINCDDYDACEEIKMDIYKYVS